MYTRQLYYQINRLRPLAFHLCPRPHLCPSSASVDHSTFLYHICRSCHPAVLYVHSFVSDDHQLTPDSLQAELARIVESARALATHNYTDWLQYATSDHIMTNPPAPDSSPSLPDYHDPASCQDRPSSPPSQTIDPSLLLPPPPPVLSKGEARSKVRKYIGSAGWLRANTMETNVGDLGVPACASLLAEVGCPIFKCLIDEIKQRGITKYKCADCGHIIDRIDRALEHQRSKLDHKPFSCPKGW
jgi:hypothetical protein